MRTLIHLSDLHFFHVDLDLIDVLIETVTRLAPHVVVVSGDLTQRARTTQFLAARRFLDSLPSPQVVVPGNHDVPLHNLFHRLAQPHAKFRRHITSDLEPSYIDKEIAVLGVCTARALAIQGGRITRYQVDHLCARLAPLGAHVTKIVVTHHPLDLPSECEHRANVLGSKMAITRLASSGVDLLLAGHLHTSRTGTAAAFYKLQENCPLVVQAGTATSTRSRGEPNSFNVIRIEELCIEIERYAWAAQRHAFTVVRSERFQRSRQGWRVMQPSGRA